MKRIFLRLIHGICYVANVIWYFLLFPWAFIFLSGKHIWLISEVNYDARDNGLALFEYIRKEKPNVHCYYCISKKNVKYAEVHSLGKTIEPNSIKHLFFYIGAKYKISTIVNGCVPGYYLKLFFKKHHPYGKNINLKHGIYKDFSPMDLKQNAHCDLLICGAKHEYEYILKTYGYTEKEVKYTGLARFDKLFNANAQKRIMIMPTWRAWLDNVSYGVFKESDYFKNWIGFLNDSCINEAIELGYEIIFFLHPKMNGLYELLNDLPKKITVATSTQKDESLENIISTSSLLITDFSSVFFDFAFMNRAAIYFQFDSEQFYKNHYKKTYFDYMDNGYGPVCNTLKELAASFKECIKANCQVEQKYIDRAKDNFVLRDNKNCERIFQEIENLK